MLGDRADGAKGPRARMQEGRQGDEGAGGASATVGTVSVSGSSFGSQQVSSIPPTPMGVAFMPPAYHVPQPMQAMPYSSAAPTAGAHAPPRRGQGDKGKKPGSKPGSPYTALTFIADFLWTDIMNHGLCVSARVSMYAC